MPSISNTNPCWRVSQGWKPSPSEAAQGSRPKVCVAGFLPPPNLAAVEAAAPHWGCFIYSAQVHGAVLAGQTQWTGTWDRQVLPDEIRATAKPAKKVLAVIQAALLFTEERDAVHRVIWPMQCAQSGRKEKNPPHVSQKVCATQLSKKKKDEVKTE